MDIMFFCLSFKLNMKAVNLKYKYIFASLCLLVAFFSGYHLKQLYGSNHRQKNIFLLSTHSLKTK